MASISSAFPKLYISSEDITNDWLSKNCKSFFFCCSLEPISEEGNEFEFRLTCYSQNVQLVNGKQQLTFEILTAQPQPIPESEKVSLNLTHLVINDMYIRYDALKAIVESSPLTEIEFHPATKGSANNIAYTLEYGNESGPAQLNPCPPATADVIYLEDIIDDI